MALKALIVEDEPDLVDLLRYRLEKEGYSCVESGDGIEALRQVRTQRPDFLILDLMLPELDGLEVCRQLRRDPATARLPIIILTAKAEEVDRIVGLEMGAGDYLVKSRSALASSSPVSKPSCVACNPTSPRRSDESAGLNLTKTSDFSPSKGPRSS